MDEKQKKSVFAALKTSKQWTYLLAASMLTLVPITASATATGSENENTVQAVQQAKKTVTGLVKDAHGEPVIGATVAEVGNATNATITILGYGAMAGNIGGGGLGAIALMRGYGRNQIVVLYVSVIILIILVQIIQSVGTALCVKTDKRIRNKSRKGE